MLTDMLAWMRARVGSACILAAATFRRFWPFLIFISLDSADLYQKYIRGNIPYNAVRFIELLSPYTPIVVIAGLVWSIVMAFHDQRMALLALAKSVITWPLLAVDFEFKPDYYRWLRLRNLGPGRAFDIGIDSVARGPFRSTFECIHVLGEGESVTLGGHTQIDGQPVTPQARIFQEMLRHGAEAGGIAETELVIRYKDANRVIRNTVNIVVYNGATGMLSVRNP